MAWSNSYRTSNCRWRHRMLYLWSPYRGMTASMIRCREKLAHVCGRGPLIEVELPRRCRAGTAGNDPKPTSDALRRSRHEANGAFPFGSGARLCAHRDPGGQSARDLILARRSFHGGQDAARPAHRALRSCRLQLRRRWRHLGRCDKAASAAAAVTTAAAISPTRSGRRLQP